MVTEFSKLQHIINNSVARPKSDGPQPMKNVQKLELENCKVREGEIVRKGIKRLQMQIKQYISANISRDLFDIALIKKCKTTDIPALNWAMGNIQKAL